MKRVFAMILLIVSSCSFLSTKMSENNSILAKSECALPCWYGIKIDSTTKQQVLDILSTISDVNQSSIALTKSNVLFDEKVFFTMGKGPVSLKLDNGDTVKQEYLWSGEIGLLDNKVAQLVLTGDLGITIQQLIDIFGEPVYVIPFYTSGGHIWVEMMDPSHGVDFGYRAEGIDSKLAADTPIDSIMIFNTNLYDEMTRDKMFLYLHQGNSDLKEYTWKGFGNLSTYWHAK